MRTRFLAIVWVVLLLLLVPVFSFMNTGTAAAADGLVSKIVYPNKPSYEKNEVVVACCQFERVISEPAKNLEKIKRMTIEAAEKGANIILFAEFALANYGTPETVPGPSSLAIADIAKKYGVYVVYGFQEKNVTAKPGDYPAYDSTAIIGPNGIIGVYRKTHLAPVELYEKGAGPIAFNTPWGPVGVTICYDNYSYHELHRIYALMGARLVLNATNIFYTPDMKDNFFLEAQYHRGLQSLIGENWSFIASANNVGWSAAGLFSFGKSEIIGPARMYLAPTYEAVYYAGPGSDKEEIVMGKLDLTITDKLREFGKMFWADPMHHDKPTFETDIWVKWMLPEDKLLVDRQTLHTAAQEKASANQTRDIAIIVAAVLLLSTIIFAILAFKPKKK